MAGLYDDFDEMFNKASLDEDTPPEYEGMCRSNHEKRFPSLQTLTPKESPELKSQLEKGASPADVIETVRLAAGTTRFMFEC